MAGVGVASLLMVATVLLLLLAVDHAVFRQRDRLAQHEVAGQQFRRMEALAAFQRMLAQHPRAEAVDGEDGGQVDLVGGLAQAAAQLRGATASGWT